MRQTGRHPAFAALLLVLPLLSQCADSTPGPAAGPTLRAGGVALEPAFPALSFESPLFFTQAPGDDSRAFVVTQGGVIHVFAFDAAAREAGVFLDISERVTDDGGEQGLLGLAFDPGYASNGHFYLNYNPNFAAVGGEPRRTSIARFRVSDDPAAADPASETELLSYEQPFANHKGGWLGFGPDGKLYISAGDGGSAGDPSGNAQNLGSLLGKILRINPDGSVPADNPFTGQAGARGEIWAYGLRNPFRASFDRATGELWAGDVGQGSWEEIDLVTAGGNYGWRKYEGNHVYNETDADIPGALGPVHEYDHEGGRCSITGGYVYRGTALGEAYQGAYFYADYCSGELWALQLQPDGSRLNTALGFVPGNPTSFGEDNAGELYVTSFDGQVYKLVPAAE